MTRTLALALCVLAFAACSKPEKPETERRPEPQASSTLPDKDTWNDASKREPPATALLERIQKPMDKAKAVEGTVLEQGQQQAADIDAQTAGNASPPPGQ
jgi:hypothetical protein